MKRIISQAFFLVTLFFVLISCSNKDVQPTNSAILKSILYTSNSTNNPTYSIKSKFTIEYLGSEIAKTIRIDSLGLEKKTINTTTANFTYSNKILSKINYTYTFKDAISSNKYNYQYVVSKNNSSFEIIGNYTNYQIFYQIEENTNGQMIRSKDLKTVGLDANGKTIETAGKTLRRYEYDSRGNVIKVYSNLDSSKEFLVAELTYDSNPNAFGALKWAYQERFSDKISIGESKNNLLTAKSYDSKGVLKDNYTMTYIYDKNSGYPLSSTYIIKRSTSPSTYIDTYTFIY